MEEEKITSAYRKTGSVIKSYFDLQSIFVYLMILIGSFGLGLMNWADLSFDFDNIDEAYWVHTMLQLFSFGSIISGVSLWKLQKLKDTSTRLKELTQFINEKLSYFRPHILKEYIDEDNYREKKDRFLEKYRNKLGKLEENAPMEATFVWKNYMELRKENPDLDIFTLNRKYSFDDIYEPMVERKPRKQKKVKKEIKEYVKQKEEYLTKLENPDDYVSNDSVYFDEIEYDDIVSGINSDNNKKRVPREKEGVVLSKGVSKGLFIMFIGSLISTSLFVSATYEGLDAIIKTLITVFFVLLSSIRGIVNAQNVFHNVTLPKQEFRKQHLHAYSLKEASEYGYYVGKLKQKKETTKQKEKETQ